MKALFMQIYANLCQLVKHQSCLPAIGFSNLKMKTVLNT